MQTEATQQEIYGGSVDMTYITFLKQYGQKKKIFETPQKSGAYTRMRVEIRQLDKFQYATAYLHTGSYALGHR